MERCWFNAFTKEKKSEGLKKMGAWKLTQRLLFFNQIPNRGLKTHFSIRIFSCLINKARSWGFHCVKRTWKISCLLPAALRAPGSNNTFQQFTPNSSQFFIDPFTVLFSNLPLTFSHLLSLFLVCFPIARCILQGGREHKSPGTKMPNWPFLLQKPKVTASLLWTCPGSIWGQLSLG